jgi:biopolymer transport protein ExbD
MGMSVGGAGESMVDINTTPLIDVMLVLIITLIVSLPIMTHVVKLGMPQDDTRSPTQSEAVQIEVDFDGTIYWNRAVVALNVLDRYMRHSAAQVPQPEIHLRPSPRARYDTVAKVLASAQRNDVTRIGFAGNERFMD